MTDNNERFQQFSGSVYGIITAIIALFIAFGVAIQVSAIYVFTRKSFRDMKLTKLFINVAVANLTILVIECPLLLVSSNHGRLWPDSILICNLRGFICGAASINMIITLQFLVTKTAELVKNNKSRNNIYRAFLLRESTLIVFSWLYSMLCMLPPVVGWSDIHMDPSGLSCALDWWTQTTSNKSYLVVLSMVTFVLPVGYLAFQLISLRMYFARQKPSSSDVVNRNREMYRSKMKMVLLSTIMFTMLWLPYCLCGLLSMSGQADWFRDNAISFVPSVIAKSSCVYSPITYCIANRRFRSPFLRVISCGLYRGGEMVQQRAHFCKQVHPKITSTNISPVQPWVTSAIPDGKEPRPLPNQSSDLLEIP